MINNIVKNYVIEKLIANNSGTAWHHPKPQKPVSAANKFKCCPISQKIALDRGFCVGRFHMVLRNTNIGTYRLRKVVGETCQEILLGIAAVSFEGYFEKKGYGGH